MIVALERVNTLECGRQPDGRVGAKGQGIERTIMTASELIAHEWFAKHAPGKGASPETRQAYLTWAEEATALASFTPAVSAALLAFGNAASRAWHKEACLLPSWVVFFELMREPSPYTGPGSAWTWGRSD